MTRPRLPPTSLVDITTELIQIQRGWKHFARHIEVTEELPEGPPTMHVFPAGWSLLPTAELRVLWADRLDWRQRALDLIRRGKWRKP